MQDGICASARLQTLRHRRGVAVVRSGRRRNISPSPSSARRMVRTGKAGGQGVVYPQVDGGARHHVNTLRSPATVFGQSNAHLSIRHLVQRYLPPAVCRCDQQLDLSLAVTCRTRSERGDLTMKKIPSRNCAGRWLALSPIAVAAPCSGFTDRRRQQRLLRECRLG